MAGPMLVETKCPVCGKEFIPAPLHVYKTRLSPAGGPVVLVCSWSCVRNGEKMLDEKRKRSKRTVQGIGKR